MANNEDCYDNDPTTIGSVFYADTDGDGYGDPNNTTVACTTPTGYVSNNSDCNDENSLVHPNTVWFPDADGDSYPHVTNSQDNGITQCEQPVGYVLYVRERGRDCDDTDGAIHPDTVWYEDLDGDSLGDPNKTKISCTQPTNYVLNATLVDPIDEEVLPDISNLDIQDMNTTYSVEPYQAVTSLSAIDALENHQKIQSKTYYDGLGRPVQEVAMHAGGITYEGYTGNDIVSYIEYDRFGRSTKKYLPYAKIDANNTGDFQKDAKNELIHFYAEGNVQNSFVATNNPFSETVFDRSPRNRVLRQASPGDNWQLGSGHEILSDYHFNAPYEVREYAVILDENLQPTLVVKGHYTENELVKTVIKDENWTSGVNQTAEEFTNKDGQTILKRSYVDGMTLSTYYVYDDYNNLTYILPPKAEPDTAIPTETLLNELCFQYKYDALRRQIEKRNPGVADWERIVYDHEDRPILAQDANMALNNQWVFTKYDKFGRAVYTGLHTTNQTREALQNIADDWVAVSGASQNEQRVSPNAIGDVSIAYSNQAFPTTNLQVLSVSFYDAYPSDDADTPSIPTTVLGQTVTNNTKGLLTASWIRVLDESVAHWNKSYSFYDEKARTISVHSLNYIDGYTLQETKLDFRGKVLKTITRHQKDTDAQLTSIEDTYTYDHMERVHMQAQKIYDGDIDSSSFTERIISGFVYDALGQLSTKYIEPQSEDFGWDVGFSTTSNTITSINLTSPAIVVEKAVTLEAGKRYDLGYDFSGDSSGVDYAIGASIVEDGNTIYQKSLSTSELENTVHFIAPTNGIYAITLRFIPPGGSFLPSATFSASLIEVSPNTTLPTPTPEIELAEVVALQTVNYKYNARGSTTDINDVNDLQNDLFAYKMNYDAPTLSGAMPMYNGNISETQWKTKSDNILRGYAYQYDDLSRLIGAQHTETDYHLNTVSYDKNGNIKNLSRNHEGGITKNFNYAYDSGNKLTGISGSKTASYTYDANGNMLSDTSKGITQITYNHLDLPTTVTFTSGNAIHYLYDALGSKLKKTVTQGGSITTTEYWDGFQYEQEQLQFFAQPEGYIAVSEDTSTSERSFSYIYNYTDHLGNVRLAYTDTNEDGIITAETEIVKESNYYPFGMLHTGYNNVVLPVGSNYKYGFNGKELQEENGITWLDFGSRNYDPELGRWMNIDPQASRYHGLSPYAAMGDNPITFIDPNGEELITTLIAGAVIGAWLGGATTAIMGGSMNDILQNMLIGGIAGLASAGVASAMTSGANAVITGSGFWNGAAVGGASGFAGGFASGSLSAAFNGGSFGDILSGGFEGGFKGGAMGAAIGGVMGGIDAASNDSDFWSGDRHTHDLLATPNATTKVAKDLQYNNKFAKDFSDKHFGKIDGLNKLYADGKTFPKGYTVKGDRVFNPKGKPILAATEPLGNKKYNVYLSKSTFSSKGQLYLTMQHEYLHVTYYYNGFRGGNKQHSSIYKWQSKQAKAWNFRSEYYKGRSEFYQKFHDSTYDKFIPKILKSKPW